MTNSGFQETILYRSRSLVIGSFRCAAWHPHFADAGPIEQGHTLVFPRTSVYIDQEGRPPFLVDPTRAVFYNHRQPYRRQKFSDQSDICDFFAFDRDTLLPALKSFNPAVEDNPDRPFDLPTGPTDASTYLLQRRLVEGLRAHPGAGSLYVQETSLEILGRILALAYRPNTGRELAAGSQSPSRSRTHTLHRSLVQEARALLNARFTEPLSLDDIARELYVSPYHLCRIFRRETGSTIHQYLEQIRLRVALDYVLPAGQDLTRVAHSLGFSSHSHFTQSMRKTYGQPPTALRDLLSARPAA